MSNLVIVGNFACATPTTPRETKLLALMVRRENVRRTPSLWGHSPDYQKAIDALKARIA